MDKIKYFYVKLSILKRNKKKYMLQSHSSKNKYKNKIKSFIKISKEV